MANITAGIMSDLSELARQIRASSSAELPENFWQIMQSLLSLGVRLSVMRGREEQDTGMPTASSSNDTRFEHLQSEESILPVVETPISYSASRLQLFLNDTFVGVRLTLHPVCGTQGRWYCERLAALRADWRTFRHKQLVFFTGSPGFGRTILVPSMLPMLNTGRTSASRNQSTRTTNQLLSCEKHASHDMNVSMRDEDIQSSTSIWEVARATSKAPTFFLLASASATVATSWNNANNSAIIKSRPPAADTELCKRVRDAVLVRKPTTDTFCSFAYLC